MSKYTTEVRFICESKSGLNDSVGFSSVDDVIKNSWNKIFTTKCEFFDENYRGMLCSKILKHYYTREIGDETVGLWMLRINTKMEEIMPYYNQLYKSALLKFEPLKDVDYERHYVKDFDGTDNTKSGSTNIGTSGNNRKDLYSDTPQGALTGVESETYLTNARKIEDTSNVNNTFSGTEDKTIDNMEDYFETVSGKHGGQSYSSMLKEFRETFLNIDMMVIDEFQDNFMLIW